MSDQKVLLFEQKNITIRVYREPGYQPIPTIRLDNDEYGRGLQRFIGVTTDIFPVDRRNKIMYLAKRKAKPMSDWWPIGGGQVAGTACPHEAAAMNFARETTVSLRQDRFFLRAANGYLFKDREQEPQTMGCHTFAMSFSVDITEKELAEIDLDADEYQQRKLTPFFGRSELLAAKVYEPVIDMWDEIFPPR